MHSDLKCETTLILCFIFKFITIRSKLFNVTTVEVAVLIVLPCDRELVTLTLSSSDKREPLPPPVKILP